VTAGPTQRTTAAPNDLVVFFRQIQSLMQSGMNLYQALMAIYGQTRHSSMRRIVETMAGRVQAGERLSRAMSEFPRAFPPHVIGVVASGEVGGFLPAVLGDIALDYEIEQRASVRWTKWAQNLLWLNCIGTVFLVPAMPNLPIIAKDGLPGYLHAYAADVMKYIVPPLAIIFIAYVVIKAFLRRPEMRLVAHALVLKVPVLGRASRERSLANFSRMLWRLQASGILPIQAWETASMAANNIVVASRLRGQIGALRSGVKLSQAMQATRLFREDDRRILEIGEMSGQAPDILQRMAKFYEDAALSSAGRVRAYGVRLAILANLLVFGAMGLSQLKYMSNLLDMFDERDLEPMIWLPFLTK
jgi:type II secretory pathway component PulF